jgi:ABC-type transport system involved in multi-copper enzyme maturation permease subunit
MSTIGVPFTRLTRVELRKQVDTRAGLWLILAITAITALVMVPVVWLSDRADLTFQNLAEAAVMPQMLLLPIVGIMAATSEWSQRTGMVTFSLEPRRGRVILAKLLSAVGLGLIAVVAALISAALANLAGMALRDSGGSWSMDGSLLAGSTALQVLGVTQGVAFGLLLLNTPAAIVAYYVLPIAWTTATTLVAPLHGPAQWLDPSVAMDPFLGGEAGATDWARAATAATVWVALPLLLGTWRVLRHDVK